MSDATFEVGKLTQQSQPGGPGPLWGPADAATGPPDRPPPLPPVMPGYPPPKTGLRPRLVALGVAVAVCVLGGVLTTAIVRSGGDPVTEVADEATTPPETTSSPPPAPSSAAPSPSTTSPTTPPSTGWVPSSTSTPPGDVTAPPYGYRMVSGPAGIRLAVPAEWSVRDGAVPSNQQADSPAADKLIRFGGSTSTSASLFDTVATNETGNPNIAVGYQRIRLEHVTAAAAETVDWEFTFVKDGVTKHSYGRYWRLNGVDYVVYASTSDALWYSMSEVVDVMVATASPVP